MSKYEITPLNSNKTILQVVKGIEKYLHDNQIYKVFGYNGNYDAETELYDISDLYTSEELKADDVVLFDNCYLGIVDAVGTNNFSVKDVINFRGEKGDTGATGETGATGQDGKDGEDGVGIASISSSQVNNQITLTFTLTDGTTQTASFIISSSGVETLIWSGNFNVPANDSATLTNVSLSANKIKIKIRIGNNANTDQYVYAYYSGTATNGYAIIMYDIANQAFRTIRLIIQSPDIQFRNNKAYLISTWASADATIQILEIYSID